MSTRTITVDPVLVGVNGITSRSQPIPANVAEIIAALTSPDWATLTGTIDVTLQAHINGAWQDTIAVQGIVIGETFRGNLPKFAIGSDVLLPADALRIIVKPSVPINLGLVITVNFDVPA